MLLEDFINDDELDTSTPASAALPQDGIVFLDIETNTTHNRMWCAVTIENDEVYVHTDASSLIDAIAGKYVCGHNLIGFDVSVLRRIWNVVIPQSRVIDTLYLSRLFDPNRPGGHSLASWGTELGYDKIEFDDYDGGLSDEMIAYCVRDTEILIPLYERLRSDLETFKFSAASIVLEHQVGWIIAQQERNGFKLDINAARELYSETCARMAEISNDLQQRFPPIVTERYSNKTGKRLKDNVEVFNVGSRQQIRKRLESLGARFDKYTEKGNAIVDESVLDAIASAGGDASEPARLCSEYLALQKLASFPDKWIENADENDRIHCHVRTNGAITGRMTHSNPNLGQVPSSATEHGRRCRECFIVEDGNVLVGADADGLELRTLAHYLLEPRTATDAAKEFANAVVSGSKEDGTDVHSVNMKTFNVDARDVSKRLIYALIYGAGDAKLGTVMGTSAYHGRKARAAFERNLPEYAVLVSRLERLADRGTLPGLDGRRIRVRNIRSALNTLLQGAGAVIMKVALVLLDRELVNANRRYKFVANVHDEFQIECTPQSAEIVGELAANSFKRAGELLGVRVPITGTYKIGKTWAETH